MTLRRTLANILTSNRNVSAHHNPPSIHEVRPEYEAFNQQNLGTYPHKDKRPRSRKEIYSIWELMQKDPQIAESLNLHVTAALGGHETTGDMVFAGPHERIRGKGRRAADLREKVEREALVLTPLINEHIVALTRQAVGFGDSYARIYSDDTNGVTGMMCNVHTRPTLVMPFEQAGSTIGYHVLERENMEKTIEKLSPRQMLRVKMPRIEYVPQVDFNVWLDEKILIHDNKKDTPIMPSEVGGSFLYPVEGAWQDVTIARAGLNNQQIADSVKQAFLTINMEGMPAAQRKGYRGALEKMLENYRGQVNKAFEGGEALYGTQHHVLPQWGEKQILQSVGDLSQRMTPLTDVPLMMSLRRLAGGLGVDMSLVGWADMLAGGLGDGAAFHTSAQIMRRTRLIRQALISSLNELMALHWGLKYGEYFEENNQPWQFDFYSDQGAAATEALTNKQLRSNTLVIVAQAVMTLKEVGLSYDTNVILLEDILGADDGLARRIASDLIPKPMEGVPGDPNAQTSMQPTTETAYNNQDSPNDDLPEELGFDEEEA